MTDTITRQQIQERLDNGQPTVLVEALPARYYDQGHLPTAINIPHDRVEEFAPDLLPDKQAVIVVYCASTECKNSGVAAEALEQLGYQNVLQYVEGKKGWQAAGLAFETTPVAAVS